jgi:hypothetical protein
MSLFLAFLITCISLVYGRPKEDVDVGGEGSPNSPGGDGLPGGGQPGGVVSPTKPPNRPTGGLSIQPRGIPRTDGSNPSPTKLATPKPGIVICSIFLFSSF